MGCKHKWLGGGWGQSNIPFTPLLSFLVWNLDVIAGALATFLDPGANLRIEACHKTDGTQMPETGFGSSLQRWASFGQPASGLPIYLKQLLFFLIRSPNIISIKQPVCSIVSFFLTLPFIFHSSLHKTNGTLPCFQCCHSNIGFIHSFNKHVLNK